MLTRRTSLKTLGVLGATMSTSLSFVTGTPPAAAKPLTYPNFDIPQGACDTHVHVIGDPTQFPMSRDRDYTPATATAGDLLRLQKLLKLDRVVIVTPSVYDTDNAATIDAIRQLGQERARGIVLVSDSILTEDINAMTMAGVVGFRVFLDAGGAFDAAVATKRLKAKFDIAKRRGWHLDILSPPDLVAALKPQLDLSPVPLVFDTFGWVAGGIDQPGFDSLLSLVKSGKAYVKLSEPYRLSKMSPDYPDLVPLVRAFVAANPDRVLWGSGWPHVSGGAPGAKASDISPNLPIDAGHLLNLFAGWVPDAATRHKILVDNPARLYGFQS